MTAAVAWYDMVTAYGRGVAAAWDGLLSGRPAFTEVQGRLAAFAPVPGTGPGRVWRMLEGLVGEAASRIPVGTEVLLATTTGEIDRLERYVESGEGQADDSCPDVLLERVRQRLGRAGRGWVVSAACASSTVALALAAEDVARGRCDAALVVGCDAVTEFVYSGFASLHALDPEGARPFDRHRHGLTLGEAAAVALVVDGEQARASGLPLLGGISGWGMGSDANHMTGPAADGRGLARAVHLALTRAGEARGPLGSISAHGTGTPFNDAMELRAFHAVLGESLPPVYSVKGGLGHTLGAAGLVEAILAWESLRRGQVPPTANLREPDVDAAPFVSAEARPQAAQVALSTNSGFGGINAALVLCGAEAAGA